MFSLEEEFKKNPQLQQQDVDHIQNWISKQPHLPQISDHKVILFLHSCDYKLEQAKITIDNYFTIRTIAVDIFANRLPKSTIIQEALLTGYFTKLKGKTPDGYDVFLSKLRRTQPEYYNFAAAVKTGNMLIDLWQKDNGTSAGVVHLIDVVGFGLGHIPKLNLTIIKHHTFYLQEALPMKLRSVHLLNVVPAVDIAVNMMKPFMKPELQKLINYHQANSEKLYEHVPKPMLPKDYGGDAACLEDLNAETKRYFEANEQWFEEEERQRVDESKRQGKSKLARDELDMSGSFKKIDFD